MRSVREFTLRTLGTFDSVIDEASARGEGEADRFNSVGTSSELVMKLSGREGHGFASRYGFVSMLPFL
ncbi:unnamed protein product [Danaus chrysippus]|uniref:(African queen) hypothetical protein n=1 Tax=Danaus chrysippus TaxID=151541 RepID=A0A8J2QKH0_9NEOP|nr:unnamed protein product [Danaus chrysippus]